MTTLPKSSHRSEMGRSAYSEKSTWLRHAVSCDRDCGLAVIENSLTEATSSRPMISVMKAADLRD